MDRAVLSLPLQVVLLLSIFCFAGRVSSGEVDHYHAIGVQPLSKIAMHKATVELHDEAFIRAFPVDDPLVSQSQSDHERKEVSSLLQSSTSKGPVIVGGDKSFQWMTAEFEHPNASVNDWVALFSPAKFNASTYVPDMGVPDFLTPLLVSAPIKYQFANYLNPNYTSTGKASMRFRVINQRYDFVFALFTGGLNEPKLAAISEVFAFANAKAPLYPRLALGKAWDEMTVTWTSDYSIDEAVPFVEWGMKGQLQTQSPAGTHTYIQSDMCGPPARTVGWREPGYFHTSFLKNLWPNMVYTYKLGHMLTDGSIVWSKSYTFKAPPYPGQSSLQRVIVVGDIGKAERDGSNEYQNYQPGSLNTTDTLVKDLPNYDIVFNIGDLPYANGFLSQWDQFTEMVDPIASAVPFMIASGNHERDWPNSGSFYENTDSGGECGVPAESMYYYPAENKAKFWYMADYGMFRFCVADSEHDWREGTEQYRFIEQCLATANRHKQPWLIFTAHRVLGYSSNSWYADQGSFEEPMGRESLQKLWQKYRVDIAFYGHVHNYERTCQIYEHICTTSEKSHYKGIVNGTIHVVAGGGGSHLSDFSEQPPNWSIYRDYDYGYVKLTAFNQTSLLFEYLRSSDGKVYDTFTITREYNDVIMCAKDSCPPTTLAT